MGDEREQAQRQGVANYIQSINGQATDANFPGVKYTNVASSPKFFKSYSFLDQALTPYIKVMISLSNTDGNDDNDINIFEIPYNHVESFKYVVSGESQNTAEIKMIDATNVMTELMMIRFLTMAQSPFFQGSPRIKVEFGWVRPDKRFIKKIEDKLFFSQTIEGPITEVTSDFTDSGVDLTLKMSVDPMTAAGSLAFMIKPYLMLGPYPLINFAIEQLFRYVNNVFKDLETSQKNEMLSVVDLSTTEENRKIALAKYPRFASFMTMVESTFGIKNPKDQFNLLQGLFKYYKKENGEGGKLIQEAIAAADVLLTSSDTKFLDPANETLNLTQTRKYSEVFNKIKRDEDMSKLLTPFLPKLSEFKIHPWVAFTFLVRMMRIQIAEIKKTYPNRKDANIEIMPLILLKDDDIVGLTNGQLKLSREFMDVQQKKAAGLQLTEIEQNVLENSEFIKADSLVIDVGKSWEWIFSQILGKVRVKDNSTLISPIDGIAAKPKPTNPPSKIVSHKMISAKTEDFKSESVERGVQQSQNGLQANTDVRLGEDEANRNTYNEIKGVKNQNVVRILDVITQLNPEDRVNTNKSDRRKQFEKFKNLVIEKQRANAAGFIYIIVSEESAGTVFADENWQNKVLNTYSFRFKKDVDRDVFLSGRRIMIEGDYPEIISFKPKFDMWNGIKSSFSQYLKPSMRNGDLETTEEQKQEKSAAEKKARDEERKAIAESLRANGRIASEENINLSIAASEKQRISERARAESLKSVYPIGGNLEFDKQQYPTEGSYGDDAIRMKKSIQNLRKRIGLMASTIDIDVEIVGEPAFDFINSGPGNLLLIKAYNTDGSDSMFSGIYMINGVTHEIVGGKYSTSFSLGHQSFGNLNNPYGYEDYVFGKDGVTTKIRTNEDKYTVEQQKQNQNTNSR